MPRRAPSKLRLPIRPGAPWLLDLFCCAGGAGVGYYLAGFNVVGVDIETQPRYPFTFIQADALDVLAGLIEQIKLHTFSVVHASPPCQAWSDLQKQSKIEYEDFIERTRALLIPTGLPYVIENVEGAPLRDPIKLCGAGFNPAFDDLRVIRHRLFESNLPLFGNQCPTKHPLVFTFDKRKPHHATLDQDTAYVQVTGGGNCTVANKRDAMGTPWMTGRECNEAIPPAYTHYLGSQLMAYLKYEHTQGNAVPRIELRQERGEPRTVRASLEAVPTERHDGEATPAALYGLEGVRQGVDCRAKHLPAPSPDGRTARAASAERRDGTPQERGAA